MPSYDILYGNDDSVDAWYDEYEWDQPTVTESMWWSRFMGYASMCHMAEWHNMTDGTAVTKEQ